MKTTVGTAGSMRITLGEDLPEKKEFDPRVRRAPDRGFRLRRSQTVTALKNALRYVPRWHHAVLLPEFSKELLRYGRIYGYRFRPHGPIKARPVDQYRGKCLAEKAFQLMIDNNLDFDVALYPYELVTYGETGAVCQNWMQYQLIRKYLENLTEDQTLVVQSGHPLGLFRSTPAAPRVIITNGLMVGLYDNPRDWEVAAQMGVSSYGQMTAGGWMYIGPQGIVHGTYNTLLGAGRNMCGVAENGNLAGLLYVSSGLGGMSGAQPKAAAIAGATSIIAEVDLSRIKTRHQQGWVDTYSDNLAEIVEMAAESAAKGNSRSIGYYGNVVDLLEYLDEQNLAVDLLSDQTSCHVVYDGGYCPQGVTFEQRSRLLATDRRRFAVLVNRSLRRHFNAITSLTGRGAFFFDYGNAFLKAVFDSGVTEVARNKVDDRDGFIYPSYFENIMGPIFDYGFGPFRWVCLSCDPRDLSRTDEAAMSCIDPRAGSIDRDNYNWIRDAEKNRLVVGSPARILYADASGRTRIALQFNKMVRNGEVGPIMVGRDHHDPGGTDSPFRETANIRDGSNVCADMAAHCFAGNSARGMSLVALHNGGGTGIGKAVNGGFGLVLDGSLRVDEVIVSAMNWDVMGGVARRNWGRNPNAMEVSARYNCENTNGDQITIPYLADDALVAACIDKIYSS
ncbi:urocanate hydratase [Desulforhopalus singaporensis]|uniref:Urocanate hydratase n=2 Tax=Desulforhopalus singaporensis TaxID=91360 RepID=A0A1H0J505_9BACT|nr:urocanate hydratase [Desulforhopalus singaporensis]SDO38848.1 urocanate hydratase [Desulforhopalus singaporensis]